MNSDSHFLIGHSHNVCEDYALSGKHDDLHYAIVSDGCSASKDVDIGARILAKTAESVIKAVYTHPYQPHYYWNIIGSMIISNAQRTIRSLGIADTALDATLLFAVGYEDRESFSLFAYGDGSFSYYDIDNKLHIIDIEYESGAPYYLSYRLDKQRQEGYRENFPGKVNINHYYENDDGKLDIKVGSVEHYDFEFCLDVPVGSYISVFSDGTHTFSGLKFTETAKEFMNFKNHTGDFVKRRMNVIKRRCDKEGIKYSDDVSMASIYVG